MATKILARLKIFSSRLGSCTAVEFGKNSLIGTATDFRDSMTYYDAFDYDAGCTEIQDDDTALSID